MTPAVTSAGAPGAGDLLGPPPAALSARLPLWYQVSQSLRASALHHRGDQPTRLPTEADLARHYGVSLATVRQALSSLEAEGLISRHRRRGTFINPAAPGGRTLRVLGSVDTILAQQASDEVRLLSRTVGPPPPALAADFAGQAGVAVFRRLRLAAGEPVSYAENYIPLAHAARIDDDDLRSAPMTMVLRDKVGLALARIDNEVEARSAPPAVASLLEVGPLAPVLVSTNRTYDDTGAVVDGAVIHYRSDRFRFALSVDLSS